LTSGVWLGHCTKECNEDREVIFYVRRLHKVFNQISRALHSCGGFASGNACCMRYWVRDHLDRPGAVPRGNCPCRLFASLFGRTASTCRCFLRALNISQRAKSFFLLPTNLNGLELDHGFRELVLQNFPRESKPHCSGKKSYRCDQAFVGEFRV
jgi:hypothetical protein